MRASDHSSSPLCTAAPPPRVPSGARRPAPDPATAVVQARRGWRRASSMSCVPSPRLPPPPHHPAQHGRHAVRNQVQQRCLAVLLDRFIDASRDGEAVVLREHGACTVFPRVCLYVADLPEERHVLGLMLNRCMRLCSYCLATKDEIGSPGLHIQERSVATTLAVQMEAARLFAKKPGSARLLQIAASHSATPFVPILGAVHGLGTGTMALFKIMSFDNLHVRLMCSFPLGCVLRAIRAHSNVLCEILA